MCNRREVCCSVHASYWCGRPVAPLLWCWFFEQARLVDGCLLQHRTTSQHVRGGQTASRCWTHTQTHTLETYISVARRQCHRSGDRMPLLWNESWFHLFRSLSLLQVNSFFRSELLTSMIYCFFFQFTASSCFFLRSYVKYLTIIFREVG